MDLPFLACLDAEFAHVLTCVCMSVCGRQRKRKKEKENEREREREGEVFRCRFFLMQLT